MKLEAMTINWLSKAIGCQALEKHAYSIIPVIGMASIVSKADNLAACVIQAC